jgi:hypothetical protein
MFYAPGFDPLLVVYQILCVQSLMYLDLGLWVCILTALTGTPLHTVSLRQLFSHNACRLSFATGWIPLAAYIINAVVGCAAARRAWVARRAPSAPKRTALALHDSPPPPRVAAARASCAWWSSARRSASTSPPLST